LDVNWQIQGRMRSASFALALALAAAGVAVFGHESCA
jgi:hypothetical protein